RESAQGEYQVQLMCMREGAPYELDALLAQIHVKTERDDRVGRLRDGVGELRGDARSSLLIRADARSSRRLRPLGTVKERGERILTGAGRSPSRSSSRFSTKKSDASGLASGKTSPPIMKYEAKYEPALDGLASC